MVNIAEVKYICDRDGSRFEVVGPKQLLDEMVVLGYKKYKFSETYTSKHLIAWDNWGVKCSITGDFILLNDLNYWDNDEQVAFKGIEQAIEYARRRNWFKNIN